MKTKYCKYCNEPLAEGYTARWCPECNAHVDKDEGVNMKPSTKKEAHTPPPWEVIGPDMLSAMQAAVGRFDSVRRDIVPGGIVDQAVQILRAAIAKAEKGA